MRAGPCGCPVETTPEFMQLPLEYQGFCGWTCAKKGAAAAGQAGWASCGTAARRPRVGRARGAILQGPGGRVRGCGRGGDEATRVGPICCACRTSTRGPASRRSSPPPKTRRRRAAESRGQRTAQGGAAAALLAPPVMKDAACETPLHFVEKNMDPSYEFNEWRCGGEPCGSPRLKSRQRRPARLTRPPTAATTRPRSSCRRSPRRRRAKNRGRSRRLRIQYLQGIRGGAEQDARRRLGAAAARRARGLSTNTPSGERGPGAGATFATFIIRTAASTASSVTGRVSITGTRAA